MPPALPDSGIIDLSTSPEQSPEPPPARKALFPVIDRSPARKVPWVPRTYGDEPLPIRLSTQAPRNAKDARIVGRVNATGEGGKVTYTVMLGSTEVSEVDLDEILTYVSPYDLEEYENEQFKVDGENRRAVEVAKQAERERKLERQKDRARRKGVVLQVDSGADSGADDEGEVAAGRHGRARPTYKHLFKVPEQGKRRRRRRDPATGELMPLSDEEGGVDIAASSSEEEPSRDRSRPAADLLPGVEPHRRRRRKRDPVTGDLLPLSPEVKSFPAAKESPVARSEPAIQSAVRSAASNGDFLQFSAKRPRRRRHPQTGELMPLGWRYEDEAEGKACAPKPAGIESGPSSSMERLSIGNERGSKRIKLTSEPSSGDDRQARPFPSTSPTQEETITTPKMQTAVQVMDLGLEDEDDLAQDGRTSAQLTPKLSSRPKPSSESKIPLRRSSASSSEEQITLASFLSGPSKKQESATDSDSSLSRRPAKSAANSQKPTPMKNSMMNSQASQGAGDDESESEVSGDNSDDGEWTVEAIVEHHMSDPKTHPGKPATMLYLTKWEGFPEETWEPAESFDESIIKDYRRRVGLDKPIQSSTASTSKSPAKNSPLQAVPARAAKSASPAKSAQQSGQKPSPTKNMVEIISSDEDSGYEVEAILGHHMSDPRTHPGKPATMLYKVKWVGFKQTTWEPAPSLSSTTLLKQYQKRVGLTK
ncbi:hypothetical protein TI39_contig531g00009 [Zymoseptoria brevis]|uniref:Chromo domain-containing protein n=1 Tax=Zymoseptoria brevis TaxID=1047168 RepID=A0A0F4GLX9_9PEZI|nr:hypothetical protein TI39_contig531g00009 [Zymoseptoria brevis]